MIIIEGPDNSGKSTLAKAIGLPIKHPGPKPESVRAVIDCLRKQQRRRSHAIVHDRVTCISHWIYQQPAIVMCRLLDQKLQFLRTSSNVVIVYCRPPDSSILNWSHHIPKGYVTAEYLDWLSTEHPKIVKRYDEFFSASGNCPNPIRFDYVNDDLNDVVEYLRKSQEGLRYGK